MIFAIALATLRQWLKTPLILLGSLFLYAVYLSQCVLSYVSLQGVGHESRWLELYDPLALIVVLGTGIIGRDLGNGTLALIFTRPIARSDYVFTKWIVLALTSCLISVAELTFSHIWFVGFDQAGASNVAYCEQIATAVFTCIGVSASLVTFSALRPGPFAGTGLWLLLYSIAELMQSISKQQQANAGPDADPIIIATFGFFNFAKPIIAFLAEPLKQFTTNNLSMAEVLTENAIHWVPLSAWLFNLVLCLSIAVFVLRKRELGYGSQ